MAGVVTVVLTDHELEALEAWYVAHYLAGENSQADDQLNAKIRGYRSAVACHVTGKCARPFPTTATKPVRVKR